MSNADPGRARPVFQWLAQLFALMGKESKQIIRDPSSYLVAAILPMIFLLLFGYGITLDAGVMDTYTAAQLLLVDGILELGRK